MINKCKILFNNAVSSLLFLASSGRMIRNVFKPTQLPLVEYIGDVIFRL